jgi:hypothetical protein
MRYISLSPMHQYSIRLFFLVAFGFISKSLFSQAKELEVLRSAIYRYTQYDKGKIDSIPKNKANDNRLKSDLDRSWMDFVLHKDSKNLDVLKKSGVDNRTSYIIGNHNYFFHERRKDPAIRTLENNVNFYSIGFYGIYDYDRPNFVYVYMQPFVFQGRELVVYHFSLKGQEEYLIKDLATNKIVFQNKAMNSGAPIVSLQSIDKNHCLIVEALENHGQRAFVLETQKPEWKILPAFQGKAFRNSLGDYKDKVDAGPRKQLRFAVNHNITSIYGDNFLKSYQIKFDSATQTISYKQYRKEEKDAPVIEAKWKNNTFVMDDYYIGEHLNDEPMPFPG